MYREREREKERERERHGWAILARVRQTPIGHSENTIHFSLLDTDQQCIRNGPQNKNIKHICFCYPCFNKVGTDPNNDHIPINSVISSVIPMLPKFERTLEGISQCACLRLSFRSFFTFIVLKYLCIHGTLKSLYRNSKHNCVK